MKSVEEAREHIISETKPISRFERVNLSKCIGRVLAEDVLAPFDQPPFTNSAMDGFAVRAADVQSATKENPVYLHVDRFQSAGSEFCNLKEKTAIEIATGAPLPEGADAVVMKEHVQYRDNEIMLEKPMALGKNVRKRGEDLLAGTPIFRAGEKIREKNMGLLGSGGFATLTVVRQPKALYFATGNEIVNVGESKKDHQIYNSNATSLEALFKGEGCEFQNLGICKDTKTDLHRFLDKASELKPDILVLTGGVSVGKYDFVKVALEEKGAKIIFHKVAMKPGKPILFATWNDMLIFGLPGNPLSAQVGFYQFILPVVRRLLNCKSLFLDEEEAILQCEVDPQKRHLFLVGKRSKSSGRTYVTPLKEGSGNVASFALGDCFISVPIGKEKLSKDSLVTIQLYI